MKIIDFFAKKILKSRCNTNALKYNIEKFEDAKRDVKEMEFIYPVLFSVPTDFHSPNH